MSSSFVDYFTFYRALRVEDLPAFSLQVLSEETSIKREGANQASRYVSFFLVTIHVLLTQICEFCSTFRPNDSLIRKGSFH